MLSSLSVYANKGTTKKIMAIVIFITLYWHLFHIRKFIFPWMFIKEEKLEVREEIIPDVEPKQRDNYIKQVMDHMDENDSQDSRDLKNDDGEMRVIPSSYVKIYLDDLRGRGPKMNCSPKYSEDSKERLKKDLEKLAELAKYLSDPDSRSILNLPEEKLTPINFFKAFIADAYKYFGFPSPFSIIYNLIKAYLRIKFREWYRKFASFCSESIKELEDMCPPFRTITKSLRFCGSKIVDVFNWIHYSLFSRSKE